MVRYPITHPELLTRIAAHDRKEGRRRSWPARSKAALQRILDKIAQGEDPDIPSLWSEIKAVYVELQGGKCGFCERLIGADEVIANEQDVEHFRPKKGVNPWPPPDPIGADPWPADLPRSTGSGKGYLHLAFHELNYVVSCKTCNARFKANYFPIRGTHDFSATDPGTLLTTEEPYLIHPLDGMDADPEEIISFEGFTAVAAPPATDPRRRDRALVSITFFGLNDVSRQDQLLLARAKRLIMLGDRLKDFEQSDAAGRDAAWVEVQREFNRKQDFANCVRTAIRLYVKDEESRKRVWKNIEAARVFYASKMGMAEDAPPPPNR